MENKNSSVTARLKGFFFKVMTAPILLFAGIIALRLRDFAVELHPGSARFWGIVLLIFSALFGIALPILLRTLFNERALKKREVDTPAFENYQKMVISTAAAAAIFADAAYLLVAPRFYLYGSVLAAIYGVYGAIPAEKKIRGEMRLYGIEEKEQ